MTSELPALTDLVRTGFTELDKAAAGIGMLSEQTGIAQSTLLSALGFAADPDGALRALQRLTERSKDTVQNLLGESTSAQRVAQILGASKGIAEFFQRHPEELKICQEPVELPTDNIQSGLLLTLNPRSEFVAAVQELRVSYRRMLVRIAAWDLASEQPLAVLNRVTVALSDLAGAVLDAALTLARQEITAAEGASAEGRPIPPGKYPSAEIAATRLAIVGMGKAGARELNYVSDVDVVYIAGSADENLVSTVRAIEIGTRLARLVTGAVAAAGIEPPLWELDANLRPEGRSGALVRSLESSLQYYQRWAKNWEFQALLKARALAGDTEIADQFISGVTPQVWASSAREGFVESVQRMRERVTENISPDDVDVQLKLGPGGLRDIEFTVQLLQLVHGAADTAVRQRDTLSALAALAAAGYVGRDEAAEFANDYRLLRLLEHRLQLQRLRRTHLMPRDDSQLRWLARASGAASTGAELEQLWWQTKKRVRELHQRLFYRPLLSAVAALPASGLELSSEQAAARLAAIGFRDPKGALSHIAALTSGVTRRATIQRNLMPVLISWFAEGSDPDFGLLSFRRISDKLGSTHWYLKLLRDSSDAAKRLTRVLAGSHYVAELIENIPESVAWLEELEELRPRTFDQLQAEAAAVLGRHDSSDAAAHVLRAIRRREMLRLALAAILDVCTIEQLGQGISDVTENHIRALLTAVREYLPAESVDGVFEFAVIGMGRLGGRELGIGSDADVIYVYRSTSTDTQAAHRQALKIVSELNRLATDPKLPFELDADLRPEGRNGVLARSLAAYRAYYGRWSLTWEAQALLRARAIAGDSTLISDFMKLADEIRYPVSIADSAVREVRRIKARVESERLPQGADPFRHLKLGRGSLSDVEWFIQLVQLQHAHAHPKIRTPSTLLALDYAVEAGLVAKDDALLLSAAWTLASRVRSALTLWQGKSSDVLPVERTKLEGIARILGYPAGHGSDLEHDYLQTTRRARAVFERGFYAADSLPIRERGS